MKRLKFILTSLSCFLFSASLFAALSISSVFTAKAATTTEEIVCAGASIRLATDGKSGIRFHIRMELDENDKVTLGGTKYTRSEINGFTSGIEITPKGKDPINVRRTGTWHEITDDGVRYLETKAYVYDIGVTDKSGEIDTSWYDKQFTFRGYVNTGTVYYSDYQSRSLSEVALAAKYDISDGEWNGLNAEYIENWEDNEAELTGVLNNYLPIRTSVSLNFTNVDKYLYRVGNGNEIAFSSLFDSNLVDETIELDETLTCTSDSVTLAYENGQLQFEGTGVATLTVKDEYSRLATTLTVEVIDAKNATSAASATSSNVVLLNDVSGTFNVSNGYTFHGNGFTVTCSGDGSYGSAALSYGFVTVDGGTIDNVQIKCNVFPESYLYTSEMSADTNGRYPYGYSAVVASNNGVISNSYIYGARNNIFVSGNATIDNTVTESGSLSNIQIKGTDGNQVTLKDVTTIQYNTTSSYDSSKTVYGFGIIVGTNESESNPTLNLEGTLVQYNWATSANESVSNTYAKQAITSALSVADYQHSFAEQTTVNVGIAYLNTKTATIKDNRTDKETVPYLLKTIAIGTSKGQVYSVSSSAQNPFYNESSMIYDSDKGVTLANYAYEPTENTDILPTVSFNVSNSAITQETVNDGLTTTIKVDLDNITGGSYSLKFSDFAVTKYGKGLDYTITDSNGNMVDKISELTLNELVTHNYVLNVQNPRYGAGGSITSTNEVSISLIISATKTSIAPPEFTNEYTATAIRLVSTKGGDWRPAYEALQGVKVTYWSASESTVKEIYLQTLYNSGDIEDNVWTYTCDDFTLTITGGAVHSDGSTITPVVSNSTLYFASTNKTFGTSTTSRTIILTYVFTDKNDSNTWNRKETVTYSELSEYDYTSFKNGTLSDPSAPSVCVTGDTLVTLADGTQQRVDSLTGNEMLLFWNHYTGKLDSAPAYVALHKEPIAKHRVVTLTFSDGSAIEIIGEHVFFDYTLNKYVAIDEDNAKGYLGHTFIGINSANDGLKKVELVSIEVEERETLTYEITTKQYLTCFTDTLLSAPAHCDILLNVFENDLDVMSYNAEQVANDIEAYGLYTYEDFEGLIEETIFDLFNFKYLKIAIGKGYTTWSEVLEWIDTFNSADINQPV